jgi:hypothetical protein
MVLAVDHGAIDGATDGASDGSESEVANYTDCKLSYKYDIAARTVLLYVLLCLTYMYCTLYILYILHTVHNAHVSLFPSC